MIKAGPGSLDSLPDPVESRKDKTPMTVNTISGSGYNNTIVYSTGGTNQKEEQADKTSIKKDNGYYGTEEKAKDILQTYYEKINNRNKSFSDPKAHISDKYCNPKSGWYRSDMTEEERQIAWRNEMSMLNNGQLFSYNMADYVLRGSEPVYVEKEEYKRIQYDRTAITEQINELFQENNIYIPQDTSIQFSINPYDFTLTVTGVADEALKSRIEKILNEGDNSKNLYSHISKAVRKSEDSTQITKEKSDKLSLYWVIRHETGYDLRELKNENGRFYTEDGKDILDIFRNNSNIPAAYRGDVVSYYSSLLLKYGQTGFNDGNDLTLSIEYKNGELYDIGQEKGYGPGQNSWINSLS